MTGNVPGEGIGNENDDDDEGEGAGTEDGASDEGDEGAETGGGAGRSGPTAGTPRANRWRRVFERFGEIHVGTALRTRVPTFQSASSILR